MSEACSTGRGAGAVSARGPADWLGLAAAPTFAAMALGSAVLGGPQEMLCSAPHAAFPLGGMTAMYMLMSAFHLTPWLKLVSARRGGRG
jgi:hypothetical protein